MRISTEYKAYKAVMLIDLYTLYIALIIKYNLCVVHVSKVAR